MGKHPGDPYLLLLQYVNVGICHGGNKLGNRCYCRVNTSVLFTVNIISMVAVIIFVAFVFLLSWSSPLSVIIALFVFFVILAGFVIVTL